ncbi:unnamed protein product [Moneuplotes crassus]|uniref:C2H2-type domain-containing protein n=1 Tax=Euplotes crassus TaxID=5936 RepID=A0AAD2DAB4_EUPCR|nr:unnamed protein product [Moneuplotes crassus]
MSFSYWDPKNLLYLSHWREYQELRQDMTSQQLGLSLNALSQGITKGENFLSVPMYHLRRSDWSPNMRKFQTHPQGLAERESKSREIMSQAEEQEKSRDEGSKPEKKSRKPCSEGYYCTCGLSKDNAYKINTILKKKNLEFMLALRGFSFQIRETQTPITRKRAFKFVCKYNGSCDAVFDRSWNLLDHCRMHYRIKPYQCPRCDKRFTQRGNLGKHIATHETPK